MFMKLGGCACRALEAPGRRLSGSRRQFPACFLFIDSICSLFITSEFHRIFKVLYTVMKNAFPPFSVQRKARKLQLVSLNKCQKSLL